MHVGADDTWPSTTTNHLAGHLPAQPHALLRTLQPLVGTWKLIGLDVDGVIRWEWMEGGFFLIQHFDLQQQGHQKGIEYTGYDEETGTLRSRLMQTNGSRFTYTYEIDGDTWYYWFGNKGSRTGRCVLPAGLVPQVPYCSAGSRAPLGGPGPDRCWNATRSAGLYSRCRGGAGRRDASPAAAHRLGAHLDRRHVGGGQRRAEVLGPVPGGDAGDGEVARHGEPGAGRARAGCRAVPPR